jgi:hypothetical protein
MIPWFEARRAQQLSDYDRDNPAIAELLRRLDALYLFGTIGMEAVLRSDGTVLVAVDPSWDQPGALPPRWRPATEHERTASFVIAKKRIPELAELLPSRPSGAVDCAQCKGTGQIIHGVVCMDCGALGWVAPAA